ncbi:hypothetical protein HGRIS_013902 [Hohenbuehelia grisea]|uniref:Uncharacterized protein n=1 Tax=Hohenbuehelia grisea TaxID=104357 RepID=A0ABR3IWV0_9AGAR
MTRLASSLLQEIGHGGAPWPNTLFHQDFSLTLYEWSQLLTACLQSQLAELSKSMLQNVSVHYAQVKSTEDRMRIVGWWLIPSIQSIQSALIQCDDGLRRLVVDYWDFALKTILDDYVLQGRSDGIRYVVDILNLTNSWSGLKQTIKAREDALLLPRNLDVHAELVRTLYSDSSVQKNRATCDLAHILLTSFIHRFDAHGLLEQGHVCWGVTCVLMCHEAGHSAVEQLIPRLFAMIEAE